MRIGNRGTSSLNLRSKFTDLRMGRNFLADAHWSGDKSWLSVNQAIMGYLSLLKFDFFEGACMRFIISYSSVPFWIEIPSQMNK